MGAEGLCALCGRGSLSVGQAKRCPGSPRCNAERQASRVREAAEAEGWRYCGGPVVVRLLTLAGFELRHVRDRWEWYGPKRCGWGEGRIWGPRAAVRVAGHGPPLERVGLCFENAGDYPEAYEAHRRAWMDSNLPGTVVLGTWVAPFVGGALLRRWRDVRASLLADMARDPLMLAGIDAMDSKAFSAFLAEWWDHTPKASTAGLSRSGVLRVVG